MAVKGTQQTKMVVVPYRPIRTVFIRVTFGLSFVIGLVSAYEYGSYRSKVLNGDAAAERDRLRTEVESSRLELDQLRQEVVSILQSADMDRQALQSMQSIMMELREKNAGLEEDIALYKQILSPDESDVGLVIGRLDLSVFEDLRDRFKYRLELTRSGRDDGRVEGYANVEIVGILDDQELRLSLHTLTQQQSTADIKLGFRYFQNIEGELILPEGFVPVSVEVRAVEQGDTPKVLEKSFPWQVEGF
jgi:hypothetical protein